MRLEVFIGVWVFSIATLGFPFHVICAAEPDPAPAVPRKTTPPSDLLFESIKNELSVRGDLTLPPSNDSMQPALPLKPLEPPTQFVENSSVPKKLDHRPWKAIESLLKAARGLEKQANQFDLRNEPEVASVFRNKSLMIREMVVEILMITQGNTNYKN